MPFFGHGKWGHLTGTLSANFDHLKEISAELHRLAVLAERFFAEDANTSLIKSRQFGEYMIKEIAAHSGAYDPNRREGTFDLLRRLRAAQIVPREISDIFHAVRKSGNEANHDFGGTPAEALAGLKFCWTLGVWYRRTYGRDPRFSPGPFVPPKASRETDEATQKELERLRRQVRESAARLVQLEASADDLAKARAAAEELARQAAEESAVWEQTAVELEANHAVLARRLAQLQSAAEDGPQQQLIEFKLAGFEAAGRVELDEQQTRRLIDAKTDDLDHEEPMLLDPCDVTDWKLLGCSLESGHPVAATDDEQEKQRVEVSIDLYHLHQDALNKMRLTQIRDLDQKISDAKDRYDELDNSPKRNKKFADSLMAIQRVISPGSDFSGEMYNHVKKRRDSDYPWLQRLVG